MDYFVYSRVAGAAEADGHDPTLDEEHWSYMDRYAGQMVARGPTFAADGERWTGSLHIVDLPDDEAVYAFVEREPYSRAGLFEGHLIARFVNLAERTMWEWRGDDAGKRFLVIVRGAADLQESLMQKKRALLDMAQPEHPIVFGELLTTGAKPLGLAIALQAASRSDVEYRLEACPRSSDGLDIEIHDWEFGGRR